jgi:hypothetical protein
MHTETENIDVINCDSTSVSRISKLSKKSLSKKRFGARTPLIQTSSQSIPQTPKKNCRGDQHETSIRRSKGKQSSNLVKRENISDEPDSVMETRSGYKLVPGNPLSAKRSPGKFSVSSKKSKLHLTFSSARKNTPQKLDGPSNQLTSVPTTSSNHIKGFSKEKLNDTQIDNEPEDQAPSLSVISEKKSTPKKSHKSFRSRGSQKSNLIEKTPRRGSGSSHRVSVKEFNFPTYEKKGRTYSGNNLLRYEMSNVT